MRPDSCYRYLENSVSKQHSVHRERTGNHWGVTKGFTTQWWKPTTNNRTVWLQRLWLAFGFSILTTIVCGFKVGNTRTNNIIYMTMNISIQGCKVKLSNVDVHAKSGGWFQLYIHELLTNQCVSYSSILGKFPPHCTMICRNVDSASQLYPLLGSGSSFPASYSELIVWNHHLEKALSN